MTYRIRLLAGLLTAIALTTVSGCGSSSSQGDFRITGVLRLSDVQSSSDAAVTAYNIVWENGSATTQTESTSTDVDGSFDFSLVAHPIRFTLLFQGQAFQFSIELPQVPATADSADLSLEFDPASNELVSQHVVFANAGGAVQPTATPSATPAASPSPPPTATASPTPAA